MIQRVCDRCGKIIYGKEVYHIDIVCEKTESLGEAMRKINDVFELIQNVRKDYCLTCKDEIVEFIEEGAV